MSTFSAGKMVKALREEAVANTGSTIFKQYGAVMYSATKFERRTQYYISGLPVSALELEEKLIEENSRIAQDHGQAEQGATDLGAGKQKAYTRGVAQAKGKHHVVTDPDVLAELVPGTYTVAGEAAAVLAKQTMDQMTREGLRREEARKTYLRARYEEDTKHRACQYRTAISQNFIHGRDKAELPMTDCNKALVIEVPEGHKARACVVKRLRRLVKIHNTLYK